MNIFRQSPVLLYFLYSYNMTKYPIYHDHWPPHLLVWKSLTVVHVILKPISFHLTVTMKCSSFLISLCEFLWTILNVQESRSPKWISSIEWNSWLYCKCIQDNWRSLEMYTNLHIIELHFFFSKNKYSIRKRNCATHTI